MYSLNYDDNVNIVNNFKNNDNTLSLAKIIDDDRGGGGGGGVGGNVLGGGVGGGGGGDDNLTQIMGPVRDGLSTAITMTIIYAIIYITGVLGNVSTCIVIKRNKYMHTSVNYYLFSLAVSDLLLLNFGLPIELYLIWRRYPYIFGSYFCVFRPFISETSTNASILTITAFTIERYLAICHPLRAHTMSQLSRAVKVILFVWTLSALAAIPASFSFDIVYKVRC